MHRTAAVLTGLAVAIGLAAPASAAPDAAGDIRLVSRSLGGGAANGDSDDVDGTVGNSKSGSPSISANRRCW